MMTEQKAKMVTIENAKSFISELKIAIHDIEANLNSNEERDQIAATINAIAINECLTAYSIKANAIMEALQEMEKKNKLN